jgi:acetoin utilization deacetylase AcuC-like enzyme
MILYDRNLPVSLHPFGIQIPIHDSRATRTFDALNNDAGTKDILKRWHIERVEERLTRADLLRVHTADYVECLFSERLEQIVTETYELIDSSGRYHRYDPSKAIYPLSDLFQRILVKAAGSAQCARMALEHGFCYYFSGGMHHAHADHGSGFCLINDIVLAARKLQAQRKAKRIWVIDVDAHKGDGTAAITANDDSIVTLSIHMAHGWPLDGEPTMADGSVNPAFIESDIDIPVLPGQEAQYCEMLEDGLVQIEKTGLPDLAIVEHGADPFEGDELPSTRYLKLSLDQMMARDRLVYGFLKERRIPSAYLMAGGYGDRVWQVFTQFLRWVMREHNLDAQGPNAFH